MTKRFSPLKHILALTLGLACLSPATPGYAKDKVMTLERVVILMRHGIKRPNNDPPLPVTVTNQPWPTWTVPPAWLTPHGEQSIARIAAFDHQNYAALLGTTCPPAGAVRILADTDQRTLKTAEVYAQTAFSGCNLTIENVGDGQTDARFSPFNADVAVPPLDMQALTRDALSSGDTKAIDQANLPAYALLTKVLKLSDTPACQSQNICTLADLPTKLDVSGREPKVSGALKTGSSLAQILVLEYANGFPMSDVGWGKVTGAQIGELSALHAEEFRMIARPKAVATYGAAGLLREIKSSLFDPKAPKYTLLVGHDGNIAYVGGALDLHWQAQGFAPDDPPPGSALIFELWRDHKGREFVRARYRSASLEALRNLTVLDAKASARIRVTACRTTRDCRAPEFKALLP